MVKLYSLILSLLCANALAQAQTFGTLADLAAQKPGQSGVPGDGPTERLVTIGVDGAESYDYASLASALSGELAIGSNLVARNEYLVFEIRGAWATAESGYFVIQNWTTSPTNYIEVRTVGAARHAGKWTTTAHRIDNTAPASDNLQIKADFVRIRGLQVRARAVKNIYNDAISISNTSDGADILIESCFVQSELVSTSHLNIGISMAYHATGSRTFTVRNCIVVGFKHDTDSTKGIFTQSAGTALWENNTVVDCGYGYYRNSGTTTVNNCIAQGCNDGFYAITPGTNNCSDIASDAPGTNPRTGVVAFADVANGDYHLDPSDTVAIGYGADLSSRFTTDIDGQTITTWSIGADAQAGAP